MPLEHCVFYSGELYKVCENEVFLPQGLKAAKDALKRKSSSSSAPASSSASASTGVGGRGGGGGVRGQGRGQKRPVSRPANVATMQHQNDRGTKRSSEASNWLVLVNKLSKMSFLPVRQRSSSKDVEISDGAVAISGDHLLLLEDFLRHVGGFDVQHGPDDRLREERDSPFLRQGVLASQGLRQKPSPGARSSPVFC